MGRVLGVRPLRWVGLRSYSLYLWHFPIFCVTRPGLDVPLHGWPLLVLRLVLSFGAAELSYRYVETPIRSGGVIGRYLDAIRTDPGAASATNARRGFVLVASSSIMVVALGACLAGRARVRAADSRASTRRAHKGDKGDIADQATLDRLRPAQRVTTSTLGAGHRRARDEHDEVGASATPTTTNACCRHEVLAVGDSVMLGAEGPSSRRFRTCTSTRRSAGSSGMRRS